MQSFSMGRPKTPEQDRSVYSRLFPITPNASRNIGNDVSLSEYTVNLDAAMNSTINSTSQSLASNDAHREFSEALHTMGKNETCMINPIPLVEKYSNLSGEMEAKCQGRNADSRNLNEFFHKEKNTWTLVWALLTAAQGNDIELEANFHSRLPASDAEEIDDLFDSSCDFRMAETLVDWLETRYAEERCTSNTASLHAFKESGEMYEATRRLITSGMASHDTITELDPDAPLRQNKSIHDQDAEDENRLYKCVFELIRSGKHVEAQKLAMNQGHFLLAAGMQGWKAFKGNIRDENGALLPDTGNPYRDVWKVVVWQKLNDERVSPAEKAIYAALCGNLERLLPMCPRWEDQLWARLKSLVDVAVELHLRNVRGADVGRLPDEYPKENETLNQILNVLDSQTELEAHEFFRQLYKSLMLQDADTLISFMNETSRQIADVVNGGSQIGHQLRLMANIGLFLKYNKHNSENGNKIDYIVACYVQRLIHEELFDVVPKYVLHLPDQLRETCYLHLLANMEEPTDRERIAIIEAAQRQDIDIYKYLTKFVYETIHSDEGEVEVRDEVTEDDKEKIDALKWLFVQPGHSLLGLKYVNTALRSAVMKMRPQAARSIISLVPKESVREMAAMAVKESLNTSTVEDRKETSENQDEDEPMDASITSKTEDKNEATPEEYKKYLKEYLCFQEYLEALLTFNEWFQHFHRERPQENVASVGEISSARSALSTEFAKKAYNTKLEAWKATLGGLCDRASRHLQCILNYPEGGWMFDPAEERIDDESIVESEPLTEETRRIRDLRVLRRICIPQCTSLLHTVLHGTGRFAESMEIANLIAGESLCLYKEFAREDLAMLLVKIQESAVELLKIPGNADPYGMGDA